jgi:hypothetical protein
VTLLRPQFVRNIGHDDALFGGNGFFLNFLFGNSWKVFNGRGLFFASGRLVFDSGSLFLGIGSLFLAIGHLFFNSGSLFLDIGSLFFGSESLFFWRLFLISSSFVFDGWWVLFCGVLCSGGFFFRILNRNTCRNVCNYRPEFDYKK